MHENIAHPACGRKPAVEGAKCGAVASDNPAAALANTMVHALAHAPALRARLRELSRLVLAAELAAGSLPTGGLVQLERLALSQVRDFLGGAL